MVISVRGVNNVSHVRYSIAVPIGCSIYIQLSCFIKKKEKRRPLGPSG